MWMVYMLLEMKAGREAAARRVFLRAVHACPGRKDLWLAGLGRLGGLLSTRELKELVDIMQDRELRLRTDVYEAMLAQLDGGVVLKA